MPPRRSVNKARARVEDLVNTTVAEFDAIIAKVRLVQGSRVARAAAPELIESNRIGCVIRRRNLGPRS